MLNVIASSGDISLLCAFEADQPQILKSGFHSEVSRIAFEGVEYVDKTIHKKIPYWGVHGLVEAYDQMEAMTPYAQDLADLGWRVTFPLLSVVVSDIPDWYYIRSLEVYDEKDREMQLAEEVGPEHFPTIAPELALLDDMICRTGSPVFSFSVGVDWKFANTSILGRRYDKWPPLKEVGGTLRVEDPSPSIDTREWRMAYWRYFTAQGMLTVILSDGIRIRPDCCEQFIREVEQFAQKYEVLRDFLLVSYGYQFHKTGWSTRHEILSYLRKGEDPYAVRLCALKLQIVCRQHGLSEKWILKVWKQTRYGSTTRKSLVTACNTLTKVLRTCRKADTC